MPTAQGVALGFANCSACHLLYLPRQPAVPGASSFAIHRVSQWARWADSRGGTRAARRGSLRHGGRLDRRMALPGVRRSVDRDPDGERLKTMTEADLQQYVDRKFPRRRRGAVERQHSLSSQGARPDRHQGPQVHRSHRHASASRHRRPDAVRRARQLCGRHRLRPACMLAAATRRGSGPALPD